MAASTQFYPPVCPDLVYSTGSNISIAKDRSWFTSYTPFKSHITTHFSEKLEVAGIGSVHIPTRLPPGKKDKNGKKQGAIDIDGVLHVPSSQFNILGPGDFTNRYVIQHYKVVTDRNGHTVGCIDEAKSLICLKLSGSPVGPVTTPSPLMKVDPNSKCFCVNALWPDSERQLWTILRPYTDTELTWLKQNFQDEGSFLQHCDLSIHSAKDRERGRIQARLMMGQIIVRGNDTGRAFQQDNSKENHDPKDYDSTDSEDDPYAHMADCTFTAKQLDWITSPYKNSRNFLLSYGLKPWEDDDCDEGRLILETMMENE